MPRSHEPPMSADEAQAWAATWTARAALLEQMAALYRGCGDHEYAAELEQAAGDNRTAAERLERGMTA